jgi:predicted RNA binding protein YcfA (HicA-like mRNA interferase family)
MANIEKQIRKFLIDKTRITIEDSDRLLTSYGYRLYKGSGSHRTYHRKGDRPLTIVAPKGTKYVYSPYVNRIISELEPEG